MRTIHVGHLKVITATRNEIEEYKLECIVWFREGNEFERKGQVKIMFRVVVD